MQRNNQELSDTQLLRLTSLTTAEFVSLLQVFDTLWQQYHRQKDLKGDFRKIPKMKEHASMSLKGSYNKLLFVLMYLKENPTQHFMAHTYGISQGKVSQWLHLLLPLVEKALAQLKLLPSRCSHALYAILQVIVDWVLVLDGTERPVPRSVDYQVQQAYYSGKKKLHTVKNLILINGEKQVLFTSETVEGSQHDKAIADDLELYFPQGTILLQDLGFLGFEPEKVEVIMPAKKPKGQELSQQQKESNKAISADRVKVEHAIGSIKRLRCVAEKCRLRVEQIYDRLMLIAAGLHNLRIKHRNLS